MQGQARSQGIARSDLQQRTYVAEKGKPLAVPAL
jgi:hypothetical protein